MNSALLYVRSCSKLLGLVWGGGGEVEGRGRFVLEYSVSWIGPSCYSRLDESHVSCKCQSARRAPEALGLVSAAKTFLVLREASSETVCSEGDGRD